MASFKGRGNRKTEKTHDPPSVAQLVLEFCLFMSGKVCLFCPALVSRQCIVTSFIQYFFPLWFYSFKAPVTHYSTCWGYSEQGSRGPCAHGAYNLMGKTAGNKKLYVGSEQKWSPDSGGHRLPLSVPHSFSILLALSALCGKAPWIQRT